jgi:uncharacterized protein (DUF885 family)
MRGAAVALVALAACGTGVPPHAGEPARAAQAEGVPARSAPFAAARDRILKTWLAREPRWGRAVGLHRYDGKIADYSRASIEREIALGRAELAELAAVDAAALSPDEALDLALMKQREEGVLFRLVDITAWRTRPDFYTELFAVQDYVDRDYAPAQERMARLVEHEEAALAQVAHVRDNLVLPLSKPVARVAARRFAGFATYLRGEVAARMRGLGDAALQARFAHHNAALASAADDIARWLEREVVPSGDDSHVLGRAGYEKLLRAQEGLRTPLDDLERLAEQDLAANRAAYEALERAGVKSDRPKEADFIATAAAIVEEARAFVKARGLVTLRGDARAVVRETPPFMRWNPASIDASGPFESAPAAFFNVTLPDPALPLKEREEYLATVAALRTTAVHEVYPGHFVQALAQRLAPTAMQKMSDSYSFTEGWAHYAEQMMIEEGFGGGTDENRMGQLSRALLRDCRFVVSIGIHARGMSLDHAVRRFVEDCHIDEANAREQAVRGTFDPGYFAYTLGKLQILALREEAKKKLGASFSLRRFHDALLAHGSPPVALIQDRVLAECGAGP